MRKISLKSLIKYLELQYIEAKVKGYYVTPFAIKQ